LSASTDIRPRLAIASHQVSVRADHRDVLPKDDAETSGVSAPRCCARGRPSPGRPASLRRSRVRDRAGRRCPRSGRG
jgi:hypothetical protein